MHRVISRRHTAVGQLADFRGGPSRTGSYDEHIYIDTSGVSNAESQPTGHGPRGWLEKGPSASLFVRYVSHRICSSLTPRIQTLLKPTVCLLLMTRCTRLRLIARRWDCGCRIRETGVARFDQRQICALLLPVRLGPLCRRPILNAPGHDPSGKGSGASVGIADA